MALLFGLSTQHLSELTDLKKTTLEFYIIVKEEKEKKEKEQDDENQTKTLILSIHP